MNGEVLPLGGVTAVMKDGNKAKRFEDFRDAEDTPRGDHVLGRRLGIVEPGDKEENSVAEEVAAGWTTTNRATATRSGAAW